MHASLFHLSVIWLYTAVLIVLAGALVFRMMIFFPALRTAGLSGEELFIVESEGLRTLRKIGLICVILLGSTACIDLLMRAEMMSRKPVWEVVPILPMIVLKTHIGNVWIKKMATLVLLLFFLLLINIRTWKGLRFLIVGGIAALCLTSAQSGHAADKGDYSFMILADWVHLSAIACWIGSLFPLRLFLPALLKKIGSKDQLTLKCEIVNRFSTMALWSVLALSASGIYAACIHIPTFEALFSTAYGAVLLFKITFFFLLILLGAFARFYIRPSFRKLTGQPIGESSPLNLFNNLLGRLAGGKEEALKRRIQLRFNSETMATLHLNLIVAIQCLIAVIVIGISAMLTQTSPPPLKPSNEMPAMHDMKHM